MRYEVRIYNLEEMLPENRMTYIPCGSYEEAKDKYAECLESYNDSYHSVALCKVEYYSYGESCKTLASSDSDDPYHIIVEEDWLPKPHYKNSINTTEEDEEC